MTKQSLAIILSLTLYPDMSAVALSLPTGLMPRFALFINGIKQTIGEIMLWRHEVVPLAMLLGDYLSGTLRRLAALHARFAAGKLPAAPRARAAGAGPRGGRPPEGGAPAAGHSARAGAADRVPGGV